MGNDETNKLICSVVCLNKQKILKLRQSLPPSDEMTRVADTYKALGHPLRLAIIMVIAKEECCVCDLANVLNKPVSTISQHLKTLRMVGILSARQEGKLVFYSLNNEFDEVKRQFKSKTCFQPERVL